MRTRQLQSKIIVKEIKIEELLGEESTFLKIRGNLKINSKIHDYFKLFADRLA